MKIERISDNSIKCTLTNFDLSVRDLNINELAYGSDKAKKLFSEMMNRANDELGFDVSGGPVMIEAVPLNDSIELLITKVDNPEELDARFSRFALGKGNKKPDNGMEWLHRLTNEILEGASGFLAQLAPEDGAQQGKAFRIAIGGPDGIKEIKPGAVQQGAKAENKKTVTVPEITYRAVSFGDLDTVIEGAAAAEFFTGESVLYKKGETGKYVLMLRGDKTNHDDFAKACNILAEFGQTVATSEGTKSYYDEHYEIIVPSPAIEKLSLAKPKKAPGRK